MMAVFLFSVNFLMLTLGVYGQLEQPQNILATVGSTVTLKCKPDIVDCHGITWQILRNQETPLVIYRDSQGVIFPFNQMGRYIVNNSSGCHLTIIGISMADAGKYSCSMVTSSGQNNANVYLIVAEENYPKCKTDAIKDRTEESDIVAFSCSLIYNGTDVNTVTTVIYDDLESNKLYDNTSELIRVKKKSTLNTTINYTVFGFAKAPVVPSYKCTVRFSFLSLNAKEFATNELSTSCTTDEVPVLYSVRNLVLSPSASTYSPGTEITCSAEGNPLPDYEWQVRPGEGEGEDLWKTEVNGSVLRINNASSNSYRCFAYNSVKGSEFNVTSYEIKINYTSSASVGIAVGVSVGIFVIIILITIFCFRCPTCPGYKSRHKKSKSKDDFADNNRVNQPLAERPSNNRSVESKTNQAKARPPPTGDPSRGKRPPVEAPPPEPPHAKPRSTGKDRLVDNRHDGPEYDQGVVYAMLDSDKTPHKLQQTPNAGEESEYAGISIA